MFDLAESLVFLWAVFGSVRTKDAAAIAACAVFAYVVALDFLAPLGAHPPPEAGGGNGAFLIAMALIGPRMSPFRAPPALPLGAVVAAHPAVASLIAVLALAFAAGYALRRASRLRPEIPEARRLSAVTMPLVALAVMETVHAFVAQGIPALVDRVSDV